MRPLLLVALLALPCACSSSEESAGNFQPPKDSGVIDASEGGDVGLGGSGGQAGDAGGGSAGQAGDGAAGTAGSGGSAGDAAPGDAQGTDSESGAPVAPNPIGANLPNLLHLFLGLAPGGAADADAALDDAKAAGANHVRFIASGFWPNDMTQGKGWIADPQAYFEAFDQVVSHASARGVRLVPSLLWNLYLFPDIAGEPVGKLFEPGSKTRLLSDKYVTEVVTRYASNDAILFWELGNEFNLSADLDVSGCTVCNGATNGCGLLNPPGGTPCQRTAADNFFSCNACRGVSTAQQDLGAFTASMAALVHGLDSSHGFSSGNAYPRPSAWHLGASPCPQCDWTADSPDDYGKALLQLHQTGVDVVSVHHYPGADAARFGSTDQTGAGLLSTTQSLVTAAGKTLYVGEFGEPRAGNSTCGGQTETCGGEATAARTHAILDGLVTSQVPYAAIWALDFFQFCGGVPTCYTVVPSDEIVGSLAAHNVAAGQCKGAADGVACAIGTCLGGVCTPMQGATFGFDAAGDETTWQYWTNCSGCTPATNQRVQTAAGGYLSVTSHDLPCTSGCSYPGAYALSPSFPLQGGHVLVRFSARCDSANAVIDVIPSDSQAQELAHTLIAVKQGTSFETSAMWFVAPAGAASARLRLELPDPNAKLDLDEIVVVSEP
ncbi:MAG: hypothetical protein HY898_25345 [Deltaproteobacteria bacterium]|nr:hypothetical protein [Deltaproteobacteria bacterium]